MHTQLDPAWDYEVCQMERHERVLAAARNILCRDCPLNTTWTVGGKLTGYCSEHQQGFSDDKKDRSTLPIEWLELTVDEVCGCEVIEDYVE